MSIPTLVRPATTAALPALIEFAPIDMASMRQSLHENHRVFGGTPASEQEISDCIQAYRLVLQLQKAKNLEEGPVEFDPTYVDFSPELYEIMIRQFGDAPNREERVMFLADRAHHTAMVQKPAGRPGFTDWMIDYLGYEPSHTAEECVAKIRRAA